jgi:excisionase family DNA binding protein
MVQVAGQNYLTLSETAESLNMHRVTLSKLVRTKKINAFKLASRYLIEPKEIDIFLKGLKNESN